jgi:hypothetical protein
MWPIFGMMMTTLEEVEEVKKVSKTYLLNILYEMYDVPSSLTENRQKSEK